MKLDNKEKLVFITMGVTALNVVLMANGIETMPNMWAKEVYQDPMLGASIGGMTGIGLGGMAGATYIVASETVKSGISLLREKFTKPEKIIKIRDLNLKLNCELGDKKTSKTKVKI